MAQYPSDEAPTLTDLVAKCQVCKVQWAVQAGGNHADAKGCSFCDAPANAITIISEAPDFSGQVVKIDR